MIYANEPQLSHLARNPSFEAPVPALVFCSISFSVAA